MKRALLIFISAIVLMGFTACGQSTTPVSPDQSLPQDLFRTAEIIPTDYCGLKTEVPLIVGQNITDSDGNYLGYVTVSNNEGSLYFHVELTDQAEAEGWVITETHADVYTSLEDFPLTKKGNPKVGNFDYTIESDVLLVWDPGTVLYVAVHASLERIVDGYVVQQETGWGDGYEFDGNSWAMYFTYEVQECWKNPPLPDPYTDQESIKFKGTNPGPTSYWNFTLTGLGAEGDNGWVIWDDNDWAGWCCDHTHYLYPNVEYNATLYSSYEPYDGYWPDDSRFDVAWDKINYILNHKIGSINDVQSAIWYYTDGETPTANGQLMVNDAEANGAGFVPSSGEIFMLIVYTPDLCTYDNRIGQLCGIEIDP